MKGVENATNIILICKRGKNEVISDFNLQTSREWSYKWFQGYKWFKMKLDLVLRFKWVKNLAKAFYIYKRLRNEVITDFKVQTSQEWSCKGFWSSND